MDGNEKFFHTLPKGGPYGRGYSIKFKEGKRKTILLFKVAISHDLILITHEVFDIFYSGFGPVLVEASLTSNSY